MNCIQIMRKARQGVDAILPGGYGSSQWTDEEVLDLVNEAYESMLREFRLVRQKWGVVTVNSDSAAYTREGETYDPGVSLVTSSTSTSVTLPPDFAELVRLLCTSDRTVRFVPADLESDHWIDLEQDGRDDNNLPRFTASGGATFFYDIRGNRTLQFNPACSQAMDLELDYIPMFRPLLWSNAGSVSITNGGTAITGVGTTWITDNIYSAAAGQVAEILIGVSDPQSNNLRVIRDYPRVASITSDTSANLALSWAPASVSSVPYILAMVPVLPREYHRWMARLTSSLMLSKVNPDIAEKYFGKYMEQFRSQINPTINRRQSQASSIVEDSDEFGMGTF